MSVLSVLSLRDRFINLTDFCLVSSEVLCIKRTYGLGVLRIEF